MGEVIRIVFALLAMIQGGQEDARCVLIVTTDWAGDAHAVSSVDYGCFALDDFPGMENPFFPDSDRTPMP